VRLLVVLTRLFGNEKVGAIFVIVILWCGLKFRLPKEVQMLAK
jgi:hypothetical protein